MNHRNDNSWPSYINISKDILITIFQNKTIHINHRICRVKIELLSNYVLKIDFHQ